MKNTAIEISNLSKSFIRYTQNHQKVFGELLNRDKGEYIEVLKDLSLTIKKGEKVVLIGELESGRTTLMRLIAGFLKPDSGTIKVRGKITTIFSHRMIFDATYTGKANIYLRGGLMGWSREKIDRVFPEIAEFAELTDIINQPISTYKSGAPTRLGFTIETVDKPDILLIDESFAFGGPQYFEKCIDRLEALVNDEETTLLMVNTNAVVTQRLCQRALVLNEGSIVFDGDVESALRYYRRYCKNRYRLKKDSYDDLNDNMTENSDDDSMFENTGSGMGDF